MMDTTMAAFAPATPPAAGAAPAASAAPRGNAGERDFLDVLRSLVPEAVGDDQDAEAAVADALAGLAQLGEGDPGEIDADAWQIAALLARFTTADTTQAAPQQVPTDGALGPDMAAATTAGDTAADDTATIADLLVDLAADAGSAGAAAGEADMDGEVDAEAAVGAAAERLGSRGRGDGLGARTDAPGQSTAAAARAAAAEPTEAVHATPAARLGDEATPREVRGRSAPAVQGLDLDVDAGLQITRATPTEPAAQQLDAVRSAAERSFSSSASSIQRVLDAVELLENAPPPRQLTLEVGEHRLRVAIEHGEVRLHLLGDGVDDDARALLEDARSALEERGFDLGGDRGQARDGRSEQTHDDPAPTHQRPAARPVAGLRL